MLVILLTESNTSFLDTHALVKFLEEPDEPTCIVPINRIEKKETLEYNGSCKVIWSNRKSYKAFLLFSGTYKIHIIVHNHML